MECRIFVSDDDISFWEESKISPAVAIDSMRDVLRVFVNGQLTGDGSSDYDASCKNIGLSIDERASVYFPKLFTRAIMIWKMERFV